MLNTYEIISVTIYLFPYSLILFLNDLSHTLHIFLEKPYYQ